MLSKLLIKYNKEKIVMPVIHFKNYEQAKNNILLCKQSGADGVWLINHNNIKPQNIIYAQHMLSIELNWDKINLNLLGFDNIHAITRTYFMKNDCDIWVDNAGVEDEFFDIAVETNEYRKCLNNNLYFGGFSFKYQKPVLNLHDMAIECMKYVDVITTSGVSTGLAADLNKIKTIRTAVGTFPIAIASGITPDNINDYLPYVNIFMVATGISDDFYNINSSKLSKIIDEVNSY